MAEQVTHDDMMRYLDGEASPEERKIIEDGIQRDTELNRELVVFQAMRSDLLELRGAIGQANGSVWDHVNRRLTRPLGWVLFVVGFLAWAGYGGYVYLTSSIDPFEKLMTSAITLGIMTLLATVVWERYREWLTDPYKHVQR